MKPKYFRKFIENELHVLKFAIIKTKKNILESIENVKLEKKPKEMHKFILSNFRESLVYKEDRLIEFEILKSIHIDNVDESVKKQEDDEIDEIVENEKSQLEHCKKYMKVWPHA